MDYVLPVIFNTVGLAVDSESFLWKSGRHIFDGWQRWQQIQWKSGI